MTDLTERQMLAKHGTQDVVLPPSALLSVAKADFDRRTRNKARAAAEEGGYERFAFLGSHVSAAASPLGILKKALRWRENYTSSTSPDSEPAAKLSVLHLTASLDNLKLAIALAEKEENHAEPQ